MNGVTRRTLAAAAPAGLAIAVFGIVFGALFRPIVGAPLTILTSAVVFSGALQFTMASLILSGTGPAGLLAAGVILNVRHLLLGAALRPRLTSGWTRRVLLSWFLTDEAVGFALAEKRDADGALLVAGVVCYTSWVAGTALGVAGISAAGFEQAAGAVFPVLFVGLAAISATSRDHAVRAVGAAALTVVLALAWPGARGLAPAAAAVVAASLPVRSR